MMLRTAWRRFITLPSTSKIPVLPQGSASNHHDLGSFLAYAEKTGLNRKSPVFVGTHYEYTVLAGLTPYGFSLHRVGGASDLGIDLLGTWELPSTDREFRVLVQCKAGSQQIRPSMLRELEGAFIGAPPGWRGAGTIGFLVSQQTATKGVRDSLGRSRWPMGFMCCSEMGTVTQMIWNQSAVEGGLEGFGVGLRHTSDGGAQIGLMHQGRGLPLREHK